MSEERFNDLPYLRSRRSARAAAAAAEDGRALGGVGHLQQRLSGTAVGAPAAVQPAPKAGDVSEEQIARVAALTEHVDRKIVSTIRKAVGDALSTDPEATSINARQRIARRLIDQRLELAEAQQIRDGLEPFTADERAALAKAAYDEIFSLGRLQPLFDDARVRNIHIRGAHPVWVELTDGSWQERPPIVDAHEDLLSLMREISSREGGAARPWDQSNPSLDMSISGYYARVSAAAPPAEEIPSIVIRRHHLVDTTLSDLVRLDMLSVEMAHLLVTAQKAYLPIIFAGEPGSGKTTMARALGNELDPHEPIVTIEEERELFFHMMPERHKMVVALQTVEPSVDGEIGGYTSSNALRQALRMNSRRIFYGESHGGEESMVMFRTMQKGVGAISTMHSLSAADAIQGMVQMVIENSNGGPDFAHRMITRSIGLVVHLHGYDNPEGGKTLRVTEIAQVVEGDSHVPIAHPLFRLDPESMTHYPVHPPQGERLFRMRLAGLDERIFRRDGNHQ